MVELIVYPKPSNIKLINNSPFCAKTEIFLKIAKIEHKLVEFSGDPAKFAKKKLPVLNDEGRQIFDSYFIEQYLNQKFSVKLNNHLSAFEKAQGFAFTKMLEEFLYWSILHERWFVDSNWVKLRDTYFAGIPKLIRKPIAGMIRKKSKQNAIGHGMSRHSDEEIYLLGFACIKALSDFIAEKKYLLGDKISSYDSTIYAFVASMFHSELGPELKKEALKYRNLVDYDQRLFTEVFS